jgi:transposase-like protein
MIKVAEIGTILSAIYRSMRTSNRRKFDAKTKFAVVVELLKGRKTAAEITSEYGVHATQQANWKIEFMT